MESIRGVFHFFLKSVFKLQKNFVPLQQIMAVTGIFPSGSVGAMHKPSGSAVPDRNVPLPPENTILVKHLKTRKERM